MRVLFQHKLPFEEAQQGETTFETRWVDGSVRPKRVRWTQEVRRVCVINATDRAIEDVVVTLERTEPVLPMFHEMPLHLMHDNPQSESQPYRRQFRLEPRGRQFIDVVFANSQSPKSLCVFHTVKNVPQALLQIVVSS